MATKRLGAAERAKLQAAVDALSDHAWVDQNAAAALGSQSPRTLERYRWKGGGPPFARMGTGPRGRVRYRVGDVRAWLAAQLGVPVANTVQADAQTRNEAQP